MAEQDDLLAEQGRRIATLETEAADRRAAKLQAVQAFFGLIGAIGRR